MNGNFELRSIRLSLDLVTQDITAITARLNAIISYVWDYIIARSFAGYFV